MRLASHIAWAIALVLSGCAGATNYADLAGPRHAATAVHPAASDDGELRVVSFNVKFGKQIERAIRVLRTDDSLRNPDFVLLQEMDEAGTVAIADSLGMNWIYYPASVAPSGKEFGNAILSCWSLEADTKVLLPHEDILHKSQRIAVAATARIDGRAFRIYCVHLGTILANGPHARREQLATVLDDAARFPDVIIGGDFNSETVPEIALARGYTWPTRHLPHTAKWWTLDHILLKGDLSARAASVGVVRNNLKASDHHPVWLAVGLNRPVESTRSGK
jgi:endonuclease/exonuclease/phosphatase family metal-dependent hydrolase